MQPKFKAIIASVRIATRICVPVDYSENELSFVAEGEIILKADRGFLDDLEITDDLECPYTEKDSITLY